MAETELDRVIEKVGDTVLDRLRERSGFRQVIDSLDADLRAEIVAEIGRVSAAALSRAGYAVVPREASDATLAEGAAKERDFFSLRSPYPRTRAVYTAMISVSDLLASLRGER